MGDKKANIGTISQCTRTLLGIIVSSLMRRLQWCPCEYSVGPNMTSSADKYIGRTNICMALGRRESYITA